MIAWYLIQIVLCYNTLVKQPTKPKFFNTENKPDYGSTTLCHSVLAVVVLCGKTDFRAGAFLLY